jgi:hypothetical protein
MHFWFKRSRKTAKVEHHHSRRRSFPKYTSGEYETEFRSLKETTGTPFTSLYTAKEEDRLAAWPRIDVIGSALASKYAWAVPDHKALTILSYFSPLIEIGAGLGYWAKLLQEMSVDIVCFDKIVPPKDERWTAVKKGGPEKLLDEDISGSRNLVLCYPDEDESMGVQCIENFSGEYIIHIGELIGTGSLSEPQKPWGRTSSAEMQQELMANFHCVLSLELQGYPHARDHLTVWKRTDFVAGQEEYNEEKEESDSDEDSPGMGWAAIPSSELLPTTLAAPKYEFLLR